MDIVKLAINCSECSSTLNIPVVLPCGWSICLKHLENLQDLTFFCKPCGEDHKIDANYLNTNKALDILVNANVENLNLGREYQEAFNITNELDEAIKDSRPSRYISLSKQSII